ncbi:MAG: TetR/AcrR family transcriptional regulator [Vicinamibacteria bacterium]
MVERTSPVVAPAAAPGRARERRDPEATRQALLAAGASLFGERGYDGVPIDDVAARAGVNKALISYHFGGKRGLYAEILAHGFREMAVRLDEAESGALDAASALHDLLRVFQEYCREHPEFPGLFIREVLSTGIEPRVLPHLVTIVGIVRRLGARGAREGTLRPVNPLLLHFGLVGPLVFYASTEPARRRAVAEHGLPLAMPSVPEFVEYLEDLTLRGLAPASRRAAPRRRSTPSRPVRKPKGARA